MKPPVLWPRSRQVRPATSRPSRASAPSSFSPPRETKRSSASSVISTSASVGRSSPALVGTRQPAGARQRTAPVAISRCAADRVGAMPRSTRSWSARIASSSLFAPLSSGSCRACTALLRHADVGGLLVGQLGQHRADLLQVQARDLLVEVLGQHVDLADVVRVAVREQLDLGDRLVGEARRHHEARVAGAAAEVHEAALGEQDDLLAVGEDHVVDLRLDLFPLAALLERGDVDLVVEVADVADDRLVLHRLHVLVADDALVAGRGDEDVGLVGGVLHGHDLVAFHRRLQRVDRVDLGDPDLRRERAQRLRRALADVAVAGDAGDLAGDHHVGGALDAVDQRLAAAVEVVELALGDRVVDVDGAEQQRALDAHLLQAVHAGRRLLGDADDLGGLARVPGRVLGELGLDARRTGTFSSSLVGLAITPRSFSARLPRCISSVASPPSSRIMFGPSPFAPLAPNSKMRCV